nr:hypothetical protein [Tanacetum cinerariifolium]
MHYPRLVGYNRSDKPQLLGQAFPFPFCLALNMRIPANRSLTSIENTSDKSGQKGQNNLNVLEMVYQINSDEIDPHCFNAESDLIESLSNRDTLFDYSLKFDYLEEISGELMPTSIVNKERIRREHEEYISLMEKLLAINSFRRLLKKFHANTIVETLPTSTIPIEDGDSFREEINIFTGMDDLLPPHIESDDYDSEGDIHFLEELISNDSISFPENESSNFDHHDDPHFLILLRNHQMLSFTLI